MCTKHEKIDRLQFLDHTLQLETDKEKENNNKKDGRKHQSEKVDWLWTREQIRKKRNIKLSDEAKRKKKEMKAKRNQINLNYLHKRFEHFFLFDNPRNKQQNE